MLYDTYGFPLEITQELAAAQSVNVDVEGFTQEMQVCFPLLSLSPGHLWSDTPGPMPIHISIFHFHPFCFIPAFSSFDPTCTSAPLPPPP